MTDQRDDSFANNNDDTGPSDSNDPNRRKRRRGRRGGRRHRRTREEQAGATPNGAAPTASADIEHEVDAEPEQPVAAEAARPAEPADREPRSRTRGGRGRRRGGRDRDEAARREAGPPRRDDAPRNRDEAPLNPRNRGSRGDDDDNRLGDNDDDDGESVQIGAAAESDPEMEVGGDDAVAFDDDVRDAELFAPDAVAEHDDETAADAIDDELELPVAQRAVIEESDNPRATTVRNSKEMLINVADPEECRIAMVADGRLEELDMERTSAASHVGNIYKGRVTNVESSIQAAFVDFGLPVHGFLHISDLHPQYFPSNRENEQVGRKTPRRDRPPIQRCLRRGQEVIVQITKEGIGTKGPTMTTYLSLPGRFLVMMPGMAQLGVSRKVEDDDMRRKARAALSQLKPPADLGFIVRTAGIDRTKRELQHDLNYLVRLWRMIQQRTESQRSPCELYKESDLVIRTIRDVYTSDVTRIIVDDEAVARKVSEFLSIANPKGNDRVVWYKGREPLFHLYGIEAEIEKLHSRHVPLQCGGSLVIDPTEALVAIDVNSGRFRVQGDAEETARRVNMEAAAEIARQLRLRDLGGLIICDFIDMRLERHRRDVERTLSNALKDHKERAKILRMSQFGIVEMTRQRQRPSISRAVYMDCTHCNGSGLVKTVDSMTLDVLRVIQLAAHREAINLIDVRICTNVASNLLNRRRRVLAELEAETGKTITITADPHFGPDQVAYSCIDKRGREVPLSLIAPAGLPAPGVRPLPPRSQTEPRADGPASRPPATESRPDFSPRGTNFRDAPRDPPRREPQRNEPPMREIGVEPPQQRSRPVADVAPRPQPPAIPMSAPLPPVRPPISKPPASKPPAAAGFFSGIEVDPTRPPPPPPRSEPILPKPTAQPSKPRRELPPVPDAKGFADGLVTESSARRTASARDSDDAPGTSTSGTKRPASKKKSAKKPASGASAKKPAQRKKKAD